jgi:hypothetical protein
LTSIQVNPKFSSDQDAKTQCRRFTAGRQSKKNPNRMFTPSQYNRFKDHPNLVWLRYQASKNYAVQQDIIKAKISEAIKSAFPDRITDENIRWVAQ